MANNPYVNKVQLADGTSLIDLTSDTVTADKLMQGYTAHDASGTIITGTATGGSGDGYVWQDAQGYVHLSDEEGTQISVESLSVTENGTYTAPSGTAYSPVTVNVSSGGGSVSGLEYEEGTWTPSGDVNSGTIYFSNTHTVAPFYFAVWDATGTYSDVTNTAMGCYYFNGHQIFGEPLYISSSSYRYADVKNTYRGTNATSLTGGTQSVAHSYTEGDTDMSYSRYWATESHINVKIANSTYWRAGRTYKWIAVWAPTT